jgi:hypothetical protein
MHNKGLIPPAHLHASVSALEHLHPLAAWILAPLDGGQPAVQEQERR